MAESGVATDRVVMRAENVAKVYGGTHALKGVDFDIHAGKVTVLLGENGAGKSTLMKIMSGVERPTAGTLILDGEEVSFHSPTDAVARGVAIIHQELNLAPNMSVSDNIFLAREVTKGAVVAQREQKRRSLEVLQRLEEPINPNALVGDLRLGQQQLVEIARALEEDARVLIMDEPTSALSATEVKVLFRVIRDLTSHGVSIVYISHHLDECLEIGDYAVVLRDGRVVAQELMANVDLRWIVSKMVGRDQDKMYATIDAPIGEPVLEVRDLIVADPTTPGRVAVRDLSLTVRAGEVVGIYGLMGAGRTELLETIAGRNPAAAGTVTLMGRDITKLSTQDRIKAGLFLVPEDRQRDGLIQGQTVGFNMSLAAIRRFVKGLFVGKRYEREQSSALIKAVGVKTPSQNSPIGSLSGGNQQKVVVAKALNTEPKLIMMDEPTRGIDVGAKADIFTIMSDLAKSGVAVLYASSEVDEVVHSSSRVLVMARGEITADMSPAEATRESVHDAADISEDVEKEKAAELQHLEADPTVDLPATESIPTTQGEAK